MKDLRCVFCSALFLMLLLSLLLLNASAETVTYCGSIPMKSTDWKSSIVLPKFDPEMGTLTGVDLKGGLNLTQNVFVENMENESSNFSLSISGLLVVSLPGSENLTVNLNHSSEGNLSGYDGNMDYSGPSSVNTIENIPVEPIQKSTAAIGEFISNSPGENVTLPTSVHIKSRIIAPGTSSSGVRISAGAYVCINYTYNPNTAKEGGS